MQTSSQEQQMPHVATEQPVVSEPAHPGSASSQVLPKRFVDRRKGKRSGDGAGERRQFGSSYHDLSPDAQELALAIDGYKVKHRRRYVTFEEMLSVIRELGYQRPLSE